MASDVKLSRIWRRQAQTFRELHITLHHSGMPRHTALQQCWASGGNTPVAAVKQQVWREWVLWQRQNKAVIACSYYIRADFSLRTVLLRVIPCDGHEVKSCRKLNGHSLCSHFRNETPFKTGSVMPLVQPLCRSPLSVFYSFTLTHTQTHIYTLSSDGHGLLCCGWHSRQWSKWQASMVTQHCL